uniref:Uncharacterized protein At2g23400 n=1 Tax=Arabidopsis thaliana TaxID=3702 RepID=O80457_ARATH|nr:hypothetical protein [Arabidopsis thaliana]
MMTTRNGSLRFFNHTFSFYDEATCVVREEELQRELMPRHVSFILDGNRRWAKRDGLTTAQGHEAGTKRIIEIAERIGEETRKEVRVSVIGNKTKIPESLLKEIHEIEEATKATRISISSWQ